MANFSWSRVLPLTATLLFILLAAHRLLILPQENLLDDCYHVYLDMGTNTGVQVVYVYDVEVLHCFDQIRKLYQPHLFPEAEVAPLFDRFFGPPSERYKLATFTFFIVSGVSNQEDGLCSWVGTKLGAH